MATILAADIGYGFTKAMVRGKKPLVILSVVGPAERIRFDEEIVAGDSTGISVKVDGRWYFVGERAERQSASVSQTLSAARTGGTEQKALFYAVAGELVKTTEDEVIVITGLPVADYDERSRTTLSRMLKGEHTVEQRGKWTREFEVTETYILPQAIGSLYALVLDRHGRLVDGDLARGRVGLIDVGMYTTNYVLVDRLRYVEVGSESVTTGMAEMLQKVGKDLKREYGLDWSLYRGRVDQAVRERSVDIYGEQEDITDIVEPHLQALADTIVSKARSLSGWGAGVELRAVVLTGGGSGELAPYIRQAYPHAGLVNGDAQLANTAGYLRVGLRRFV